MPCQTYGLDCSSQGVTEPVSDMLAGIDGGSTYVSARLFDAVHRPTDHREEDIELDEDGSDVHQ